MGYPPDHGVHPFVRALWTHPVPDLKESAVQRFTSSQLRAVPVVQTPNWQLSLPLHTFPSLHDVPLGTGAYTHPLGGLQLSAVQGLPSSHLRGLPLQTPPEQVSPVVQALPSLQALPLIFTGFEHVPVLGSQVPTTWHWSEAVQTTGLLPVHTPLCQVSVCVQALPSLQALPLAFAGFEHVPVVGLQVPTVWHWSEAVQTTGLPPVQSPLWQVSVWAQALPSPPVLPSVFAGFEHVPVAGLQVPALWHWSEATQATG